MTPEPAYQQPAQQRGSDYAILSRRIRRAGLLDRRTRYYDVLVLSHLASVGRLTRPAAAG